MKTFFIVAIILIFLTGGGYFYTRNHVLKANDFKPDQTKAESPLDLRPAIIAKLQQLVKDGSNGLYILSIGKIDPDILSSTLDVIDGSIHAEPSAMQRLDAAKQLPDDIFKIKFHSLHITGLGIEDLMNSDKIDVSTIHLSEPLIEVYHQNKKYNEKGGEANNRLTLYQRLKKEIKKIVIGKVIIDHGKLVMYDASRKNHPTEFNDVSINMDDVLMDSTTQFDKNRFLFAKHARLQTKNYVVHTHDSLYSIKLGTIDVVSEDKQVIISNASLSPIGNKKEFDRKLKSREEMYHVAVPKIIFSGVDWWSLLNREKIISKELNLEGGSVNVFFDKSLPIGEREPLDHFPHQLVMKIPFPVLIESLNIQNIKVAYTEYNSATRSTGTAEVSNVNAHADHVTNIPSEVNKDPFTNINITGLFMNKVPIKVHFKLDLLHYKTGEFSADVHMDALTKDIVNPIAEPLGEFTVKRGEMKKADAHVAGNNERIAGTVSFYYKDLHLTPLKGDSANNQLKKSHAKSFIANWFLIKNSNPEGKLREPGFSLERDGHQNFIGFIWTGISVGLLKTIGLPEKLALKEN